MPKKRVKEDKKILEKIKKENEHLSNDVNKSFHRILLKYWIIMATLTSLSLFVGFIAGKITYDQGISTGIPVFEPEKLKEISSILFQGTLAVNALSIGFLPVVGFFFVKELRDIRKDFQEEWDNETKEENSETQKLLETKHTLYYLLFHNIRVGVLRYIQTYLGVTIFLQFAFIFSFVFLSGYELYGWFFIVDFIVLTIVIEGLFPLINVSLNQPSMKIIRYIIPEKEVWSIESDS